MVIPCHIVTLKTDIILVLTSVANESDSCWTPGKQQFCIYILVRTSCILMRWCPLCTRQTKLDFYSASSLKQQFAGIHVDPLGHIILIPIQSVFALTL